MSRIHQPGNKRKLPISSQVSLVLLNVLQKYPLWRCSSGNQIVLNMLFALHLLQFGWPWRRLLLLRQLLPPKSDRRWWLWSKPKFDNHYIFTERRIFTFKNLYFFKRALSYFLSETDLSLSPVSSKTFHNLLNGDPLFKVSMLPGRLAHNWKYFTIISDFDYSSHKTLHFYWVYKFELLQRDQCAVLYYLWLKGNSIILALSLNSQKFCMFFLNVSFKNPLRVSERFRN